MSDEVELLQAEAASPVATPMVGRTESGESGPSVADSTAGPSNAAPVEELFYYDVSIPNAQNIPLPPQDMMQYMVELGNYKVYSERVSAGNTNPQASFRLRADKGGSSNLIVTAYGLGKDLESAKDNILLGSATMPLDKLSTGDREDKWVTLTLEDGPLDDASMEAAGGVRVHVVVVKKRFDDSDMKDTERTHQKRVEELKQLFAFVDTDSSGKISSAELRTALKLAGQENHPDAQKVLAGLGQSELTLEQFLEQSLQGAEDASGLGGVIAVLNLPPEKIEKIRAAFAVCDIDGSGTISPDELRVVMKQLGERPTESEFQELLHKVDANGDGEITFEEFVAAFAEHGSFGNMSIESLSCISSFLMEDPSITIEDSDKRIAAMPLLERTGAKFLKRDAEKRAKRKEKLEAQQEKVLAAEAATAVEKSRNAPQVKDVHKDIHALTPQQTAKLGRLERNVIIRSMIAGVCSAICSGLAESYASSKYNTSVRARSWRRARGH